ncbi:dipeptidase PepV [Geobacillus zalihae]|uniref:Dipeptidase PepV n=1 Tax=Geobacillus zalihae TaxID=213419 RepID=A0A7H1RRI9_9BACL|nr:MULTISPECIES: dipeptidase PepV [Geobacillus]EPR26343.1 Aminoacyl-histidine dipeptidase [Geobacillus sp. WSUCF1]OQP23023.1 dipeptidase PepV [Geobacillus zalihae]QNU16878.1 dipeptidase PepV [Geobacillus zalihae]RXS88571.1 dipeptidase PepV [Geobacillus sp. PK12]WKA46863.1 dipeptidase PepV [Geobacillus zalihae]
MALNIDWMNEAKKRKDDLVRDVQALVRIPSVRDDQQAQPGAPFGPKVAEALEHMLRRGREEGFRVKNVDGFAGHIEMGHGEKLVGVLGHIDVVPPGDGWTMDPFAAEVRDGRLYGRGAIDDKGPTVAAFYAMKIIRDLGLPLGKRVRLIIGGDEESDWRCVEHYFRHEEMPDVGFAPDADFPIIHAEKGIIDADLSYRPLESAEAEGLALASFQAGRRYNMVPDAAEAVVEGAGRTEELLGLYEQFCRERGVKGSIRQSEGAVVFQLEGVSAHGAEPERGKNAGVYLAQFLASLPLDGRSRPFIQFVASAFFGDARGRRLGLAYRDEQSGDLTVNVGVLSYDRQHGGTIGLNIRYPVTADGEAIRRTLAGAAAEHGFALSRFSDTKPHYIDPNHELVRTLQRVYEEQTGEPARLLAIGGGTYARALNAGVAFGALFPGRPDVAHQKDEYIEIDDLVKATAIYAQAIYELAK